ncbi:uncharacterized protein LACBIDRAFT_313549 [Laccaria bicolor S238N-H82]|uniref:Predicted protein n=1 Tax=Laccaria bicolor (strain S238N-H82 / ATCC MYA-4686) TaxID=486041 RepID=B0D088_LACBS|nr:uncharacterized protein LACBIDRAFT_313549 [Laccaria bicolor S238N-H82]EDR11411.1 predicted protein [Laccaria bicolor S238N-H82]|eukprot:XP_001877308.1 predicted protein [Laccaria bicolor S238N-H82]
MSTRDALWESGYDESVEVNQRALIDKVLARYSGEFTVFRELLQNSDDAQSKNVEIRFETRSFIDGRMGNLATSAALDNSLPDLKTSVVHQWTFKNNGIVFRDEDWNRLKKIAEGNPDEEKIGAFGVGFYSLFSVTEEPFVTSGGQWMAFYWKDKKDQLFARRGQLEDSETQQWTTFEMKLREPAPIPVAFDFARFLSSSITFMTHLSQISVYFDDSCLVRLKKSSGIPRDIGIPQFLNGVSPLRTMAVKSIKSTPLHIQAEVMKWVYTSGSEKFRTTAPAKPAKIIGQGSFFSSLFSSLSGGTTIQRTNVALPSEPATVFDAREINETSVSLTIFSAHIGVQLEKRVATELYRSTKKNPPTNMKFELIYTGKAEYDSSKEEDKQQQFGTGSIFQGLRADIDGVGAARVFIGHATAQTTGVGGHVAARFIPTVERESIDFMDRNVSLWNKELLYVGGFLARSAYEFELAEVKQLWENAGDLNDDIRRHLWSRGLHALKFFTFHPSTPSAEVSNVLEAAFFSCSSNNQFSILSTQGVQQSSKVRLPDSTFSSFLKNLPVLPDEVFSGAQSITTSLHNRGLIKNITFDDILNELRSRPLKEDEMIACLSWWAGVYEKDDSSRLLPIRSQLLDAAILTNGEAGKEEKVTPLSHIRTFINPRSLGGTVPLDGPLPNHLLPVGISKALKLETVITSFPWTELTVIQWLNYISKPATGKFHVDYDLSKSAPWAERVLLVLARSWPTLSSQSKNEVFLLLEDITCIPTSAGMRTPDQSYFPNANIFHDLPVAVLPSGNAIKGPMEKLLQALAVRNHVDLQIIFNRMIKTNEWTIADLTKYLVTVKATLTAEEVDRLKVTAAFPKENSSESDSGEVKRVRCQAKDLYEPLEIFRQLGLPVIDWGTQTKWRSSSDEAKLLFELGLQRYPPLKTVIALCASQDSELHTSALNYLIDNLSTRYQEYDPTNFDDIHFIPALNGTEMCLGSPKEVFSNAQWASLGFLIASPKIQRNAVKLKLKEHPSASQLTTFLQKRRPASKAEAKAWFAVLSGRVNVFSAAHLKSLSQVSFVPVCSENGLEGPCVRHLSPTQCYLGGEAKDRFHSKLFVFVDFGGAANTFLIACGARHEPSVEEIAKKLLADPREFYKLAQGPSHYLAELRNIAINSRMISAGTIAKMTHSSVLLGSQRKAKKIPRENDVDDLDEDEWNVVYDLKKPDQIIISDDTHAYQVFGDSLFIAPQEDILEDFYIQLGSRRLSSLVKEEYQTSAELAQSKISHETRALILERLPLFLHEHTHARTLVSYTWLATEGNFIVKTFRKISITKSLTFAELRLSRKDDASAVAKRFGTGAIQLWLAGNSQLDMYEVATSLNRLLFNEPKANDALLFMTILSTDLRSLKRRGYNVDRILRHQKAERQAIEDAQALQKGTMASDIDVFASGSQFVSEPSLDKERRLTVPGGFENKPTPSASVLNSFQSFRRKIGTSLNAAQSAKTPSASEQDLQTHLPQRPVSPSPVDPLKSSEQPMRFERPAGPHVAPKSNILSNIEMAIKACRPESGNLIRNREKMLQVKETLEEGYCDISGRVGNLIVIGEMGNVKVYLSEELVASQAQHFMQQKRGSLARFVDLMTSLAHLYQLPLTSLHIFYDLEGGLIAFNRNGSVFLNLRYYECWHDNDVQKGSLESAYISWYFTLAHEIAHNLVQPHNSEHEFYFSAICEKHLLALGSLLSSTGSST